MISKIDLSPKKPLSTWFSSMMPWGGLNVWFATIRLEKPKSLKSRIVQPVHSTSKTGCKWFDLIKSAVIAVVQENFWDQPGTSTTRYFVQSLVRHKPRGFSHLSAHLPQQREETHEIQRTSWDSILERTSRHAVVFFSAILPNLCTEKVCSLSLKVICSSLNSTEMHDCDPDQDQLDHGQIVIWEPRSINTPQRKTSGIKMMECGQRLFRVCLSMFIESRILQYAQKAVPYHL